MAERKKFENIKREEFETTINTINKQIENFKKELKENNEKMNDWNRNIQENLKNTETLPPLGKINFDGPKKNLHILFYPCITIL